MDIIGFADELVSNMSVPKLSYIDQNAETIGANAIQLVIDKIKNKSEGAKNSTVKIPIDIVHRETTT